MTSRLMKDAASIEIARRHPYAVRYGTTLVGVLLGAFVLGALALAVRWGASRVPGAGPDWTITRPSGPAALVCLAVLIAIAAVTALVVWFRSPFRTPRMWWWSRL